MNSPARTKIEEGGILDYTLVADAAYSLRPYIYTPYHALPGRALPDEQRVWNLQQFRTRMIVEQVNGRLKTKWRILDGRLECDVFRAPQVVSACIVLHNIDLILGFRHRLNEPPAGPGRRETPRPRSATPAFAPTTRERDGDAVAVAAAGDTSGASADVDGDENGWREGE
ncbi:unnamed protein product [Closterium sp. NIES-64]|nr:unnamed protein product [Closterium sp. NIES-64]